MFSLRLRSVHFAGSCLWWWFLAFVFAAIFTCRTPLCLSPRSLFVSCSPSQLGGVLCGLTRTFTRMFYPDMFFLVHSYQFCYGQGATGHVIQHDLAILGVAALDSQRQLWMTNIRQKLHCILNINIYLSIYLPLYLSIYISSYLSGGNDSYLWDSTGFFQCQARWASPSLTTVASASRQPRAAPPGRGAWSRFDPPWA